MLPQGSAVANPASLSTLSFQYTPRCSGHHHMCTWCCLDLVSHCLTVLQAAIDTICDGPGAAARTEVSAAWLSAKTWISVIPPYTRSVASFRPLARATISASYDVALPHPTCPCWTLPSGSRTIHAAPAATPGGALSDFFCDPSVTTNMLAVSSSMSSINGVSFALIQLCIASLSDFSGAVSPSISSR